MFAERGRPERDSVWERGRTVVLWLIALLLVSIASDLSAEEKQSHPFFRDWDITGFVESETRFFQQSPLDPAQHSNVGISFAFQPEFYREWNDGDYRFLGKPFYRQDLRDDQRSHFDLRDFYVQHVADQWEWKAGVSKVFWGVTESQHLIDVINQVDFVENFDFEDRLGQPMINLTRLSDYGTIDLFYLPYFRERTFAGPDGRFRTIPSVDTDAAVYESSLRDWHPDAALRWSHVLGEFDLGAYYFRGTSRDPILEPFAGGTRLRPVYNLMHQVGLDAQWTHEAWLLKFEGLHRSGRGQQFQAFAIGYEYTFYQLLGSNMDLGALTEYHYDSRGTAALTPFNQDLFFGGRLTFNDEQDTAILAGGFWDHANDSAAIRLEFERRIATSFTLEIEIQKFLQSAPTDLFRTFRRDSFAEISVRRYF